MTKAEAEAAGYDVLHVDAKDVLSVAEWTYRQACLLNGWDPLAPPIIVTNSDELEAQ